MIFDGKVNVACIQIRINSGENVYKFRFGQISQLSVDELSLLEYQNGRVSCDIVHHFCSLIQVHVNLTDSDLAVEVISQLMNCGVQTYAGLTPGCIAIEDKERMRIYCTVKSAVVYLKNIGRVPRCIQCN